ncbi:MAG: hypothetical protein ACI8RY_001061 [Urechidicola sp.]|jgi:hypothetical protein
MELRIVPKMVSQNITLYGFWKTIIRFSKLMFFVLLNLFLLFCV